MKKHVAFLRGINVGNIRIKMPDLKATFEQMGFKNVKTYLQTGNVVFETDDSPQHLKTMLEATLSQTFNYEAFVLLYDFEQLPRIIADYPFEIDEHHHAYVVFTNDDTTFEELNLLAQNIQESIKADNQVFYWKVARGESTDTAFAKILAKPKYKSSTTVRNINTLEKMV